MRSRTNLKKRLMRIVVGVKAKARREAVIRVDAPGENPEPHYAVTVKAAPEDGRANTAVIAAVAAFLGVKRSEVAIVSGHTSRRKVLEVPEGAV